MIGAARYFAARAWAPRYWMKIGTDFSGSFQAAWARGSNILLNRRAPK